MPSLKDELPDEEVRGFIVQDRHDISIKLEKKLYQNKIKSKLGKPLKLSYNDNVVEFHSEVGEDIILNRKLLKLNNNESN